MIWCLASPRSMPRVMRVSSRPISVRRAIRTTSRRRRSEQILAGAASRLDRVDEIGDDLEYALRQLDELDAGAVSHNLLVHIADAAMRNSALDHDRTIAERQAAFVEGIDMQRKGRFE